MSVSILTTAVTIQRHIVDNITDTGLSVTDINLVGLDFDDTNKDKWISLEVDPIDAVLIGADGTVAGVQELVCSADIYCYNTNKMNVYDLADKVKAMLENRTLSDGVRVKLGKIENPNQLENNTWECVVSFDVFQSG